MTYQPDSRLAELAEDKIAWLTTVTPSGKPAPRPVWFVFDGDDIVVFSQPGTAKLRHITLNPEVSFNFTSGRGILVINGRAHIEDGKATDAPGYAEKYAELIPRIGFPDAQAFASTYSVRIRVVPERTWGH